MRLALLSLLILTAAAPPPSLVCRPRRAPDVEAPACVESRGVVQPCSGVLVPGASLLERELKLAEAERVAGVCDVDLTECRRLRDSDEVACAERAAATAIERDAARALAAAHAAEVARLRGDADAGPSWWTVAGVGAVGVLVGVVVGLVAR